ncbi:LCP family protein [Pseudofrankia asymbiotica]|uniref:Transcriptional regulator n=1 Tax=Pseudofrankia asymbiotica TaxID=1834516 RepID=A0A1V2I0K0_9ACTN|nr:LCP family protein [Pseudofrankia asymbiotica]ONH22970.1 transcriptional regulator [Pseudofrankia asymbiotica]
MSHATLDRPALPPELDPRSRRGRRSLLRRLSLTGGAVLSALILVITGGGWFLYDAANRNVHHVPLFGLGGDRPAQEFGVENYLLVGTDSRAGTGDEYGGSAVLGQRSDSTILIHMAKNGETTMVSFPRDTLVVIPEYTDAAGKTHKVHKSKFNSAISDGGPSLLVKMIESLTGMRVNHYLSVDLAGFKQVTDAIGGVDVCVTPSDFKDHFQDDDGKWRLSTNTNDSMSGWVGGPGDVHVNGEQALAFVRQRHGFLEGDIARINRQQQFLGAVFHKAISGDVLTNPIKSTALIQAAANALTLDDDTSLEDLKALGLSMKDMAGAMHVETLPTRSPGLADGGDPDHGTLPVYGAVKLYDPADLAKIVVPLGGHVDGVTPAGTTASSTPDPGATPGPVTIPPAQVSLDVYNGSTRSGLASTAATALTREGFHVGSTLNADPRNYTTSRVLYGPGLQQAAWTVQAAVPGSITRADPTITGIHLILGAEYTTVVSPTTAGATPAAGTAPAAPQGPPPPPDCTL